jgi:hypothetical protein
MLWRSPIGTSTVLIGLLLLTACILIYLYRPCLTIILSRLCWPLVTTGIILLVQLGTNRPGVKIRVVPNCQSVLRLSLTTGLFRPRNTS